MDERWPKLSAYVRPASRRRKYVFNGDDMNGGFNDPFHYVGLIWDTEFGESRIMIDNFELRDVCPDCPIKRPDVLTGCFDTLWTSPVPNNYFGYSVSITDSATLVPIFKEVHQDPTFAWDGVGNTGAYNNVLVPYGQKMKATIHYYGCHPEQTYNRSYQYWIRREPGCVDTAFGGSKVGPAYEIEIYPVPIGGTRSISISIPAIEEPSTLEVFSAVGKRLYRQVVPPLIEAQILSLDLAELNLSPGAYFIRLSGESGSATKKIILN